MEKPKLYPVSEPGTNSSNLDGSTEKGSSPLESKRNLELYQKLMSDIENEKIAQHGGFKFESVGTILQHGILSPEKKLDVLGERSGFSNEHMQHNAAKSWRKYFFDTIDGLIKKYGTQYIKENFDSLPAPVEIGFNGSEAEKEYNAKRAYRTIRELKDNAGPRIRYFLEKVIPPIINYYLENGQWEEGKIGSKRKISDGAAPSDTKLAQAIDTFVGVGLISSTPPQTLKKYIFEKKQVASIYSGWAAILFDVPSEVRTHHPKSEFRPNSVNREDLGISDKIQPSRFRAIRLGVVSDKNEAQPLFGFSLDEELVDNKYDLKLTWPRTKYHYTPKGGYDLQATEKYKKEREEKYLDAFKEIIKDYLKKIKDFYIKKPIPILDEDYNLITNPDDILIKIFGENLRGDEIILSEFKWSEL